MYISEEAMMGKDEKPRCEACTMRKKAEENPRSFIGILWRLHTYVCPGWRAYQRALSQEKIGK